MPVLGSIVTRRPAPRPRGRPRHLGRSDLRVGSGSGPEAPGRSGQHDRSMTDERCPATPARARHRPRTAATGATPACATTARQPDRPTVSGRRRPPDRPSRARTGSPRDTGGPPRPNPGADRATPAPPTRGVPPAGCAAATAGQRPGLIAAGRGRHPGPTAPGRGAPPPPARGPATPPPPLERRRLHLPVRAGPAPRGPLLAGVCAAIGRATNTDPVLWRVLLAVLGFFGGIGILVYLMAWLIIPAEGDTASPVESMLGRGRSSMSPLTVIVAEHPGGGRASAASSTDAFRAVLLGAAILVGGALLLNRERGTFARGAPAGQRAGTRRTGRHPAAARCRRSPWPAPGLFTPSRRPRAAAGRAPGSRRSRPGGPFAGQRSGTPAARAARPPRGRPPRRGRPPGSPPGRRRARRPAPSARSACPRPATRRPATGRRSPRTARTPRRPQHAPRRPARSSPRSSPGNAPRSAPLTFSLVFLALGGGRRARPAGRDPRAGGGVLRGGAGDGRARPARRRLVRPGPLADRARAGHRGRHSASRPWPSPTTGSGASTGTSPGPPPTRRDLADRYENRFGDAVLDLRGDRLHRAGHQVTVVGPSRRRRPWSCRRTSTSPRSPRSTPATPRSSANAPERLNGRTAESTDLGADGAGGGKLRLNVHVNAGNLEVTR